MPNPTAAGDLDKFLSLLEKSTLLSPAQMAGVRDAAQGHEDPKALARYLIKQDLLTKWQAMQLLGGWNAFKIDKYRLLSQIGSSEHGRIFLAEHTSMNRRVVLRTLPRRSAERPEVLRRFLKEAQAASGLDHRNIVHVYDVNSEGDRYFVVMEYVDGRNLFDIITTDGTLTPSQAADYIRQAAEGLAHAHSQGVLHREISPGKLLVDSQGQLKILEMGISGLDEPSETASTDISGGPTSAGAYLAPEQCQATPVADERTDIYSLGATLYFLLSGKSPVAPAAAEKPQDLLQLRSDIPASLVELCAKMMAARPEDRFASAKTLGAALDAWSAQQRPAAPPVRRKTDDSSAKEPSAAKEPKAGGSGKSKMKVAKPLEEPVEESAVPGIPKFDTKPKKKSTAKSSSAKPASATAEGEKVAKPGPPLALILGAAGGGVAVLAIVIGIIVFAFMGGDDDKQVAKKEEKKSANVTKPEEKPAEVAVEKPVEPMPEPAPPMPEPMPMPDPAPVEPMPAPMPEPMPEVKPETPPETPETKPEEKPAPPMIEPFAEFGVALELPSLGLPTKPNAGATEPIVLGPVKLPEGEALSIKLIGGDKATALKNVIALAQGNNGQWEVTSTDAKSGAVVIARLALKEDQLMFAWTPEALQNIPAAGGLNNGAILLASGFKTHRAALRKPLEAAPLAVSFEKPNKVEIDVPFAPDPSAVKIEITKIEGMVKGAADKTKINGDKDSALISFGDKNEDQTLMVKLDSTFKRSATLIVNPYIKNGELAPQKFVAKQFLTLKAKIQAQQEQVFAAIQVGQAQKRTKEQLEPLEKQMELLNMELSKFTSLENKIQEVSAGTIHFRIYYEPAEGEQIDLVTSSGEGPAAKIPVDGDAPKLNLGAPEE